MVVKKTYVILSGGLGNQMFMFASAYALTRCWKSKLILLDYWFENTKQRGKKFAAFTRRYELDKFERIKSEFSKPNLLFQRFLYQFARIVLKLNLENLIKFNFDKGHLTIERRFDQDLLVKPAKVMMGLYQSHFYFEKFRKSLIYYFQLQQNEEKKIANLMHSRRRIVGELVMVHVRREDTLVPGNGWTGLLTPTYYENARNKLGFKPEQLVIFSDDVRWCQSIRQFSQAWIVDEPDPVRTLRMMTYCDHFIIAGSTLSWWGAWLSESQYKKVIAPFPFYKEISSGLEEMYIPESWQRLPAIFED
jgi:hypothetical protein